MSLIWIRVKNEDNKDLKQKKEEFGNYYMVLIFKDSHNLISKKCKYYDLSFWLIWEIYLKMLSKKQKKQALFPERRIFVTENITISKGLQALIIQNRRNLNIFKVNIFLKLIIWYSYSYYFLS